MAARRVTPGNDPLEVIILMGLPGAGKSTWAKDLVHRSNGRYKRINKDDLREMLDSGKWTKENEEFIVAARDSLLLAALSAGRSVIIDDTNLAPEHEERVRNLVGNRANVVVRLFDTPLEECIVRDRGREHPVGERVIREMHDEYAVGLIPVRAGNER